MDRTAATRSLVTVAGGPQQGWPTMGDSRYDGLCRSQRRLGSKTTSSTASDLGCLFSCLLASKTRGCAGQRFPWGLLLEQDLLWRTDREQTAVSDRLLDNSTLTTPIQTISRVDWLWQQRCTLCKGQVSAVIEPSHDPILASPLHLWSACSSASRTTSSRKPHIHPRDTITRNTQATNLAAMVLFLLLLLLDGWM